ncbi:hypothetical protein GvMRE_I1g244 [endosymbiont GvMRE of Glomus versiforme]|nr:hypothetical protein GvMRE_I1g244 [endosymbiont GvMRE of Glomus versiforme]
MKLWLANIKEGEWDWYFKKGWRTVSIFLFVAGGFLLMLIMVIIIVTNKGKV